QAAWPPSTPRNTWMRWVTEHSVTTQLPWLLADDAFPSPELALDYPDGLLAAGGDVSPTRLQAAYRAGIFPWSSAGEPLLWWSPDPRCVIEPVSFVPSKSLVKTRRQTPWRFTCNQAFSDVITACAAPRPYADETWITSEIQAGYVRLHTLGWAQSIEVWCDGELVGGLYGVTVGKIFCGESMFSRRRDASKLAFWALMSLMQAWQVQWVDCQLENDHLLSLGATIMSRSDYLALLGKQPLSPSLPWLDAHSVLTAAGFTVAEVAA
ncbi:MAG: leucyl/phenylalanyl-tRNA--protein transferase, partial [Paraperlucidibaca sp.]